MIFQILTPETIDIISRHCPRAFSTFIACLNRVDDEGRCCFSKEDITLGRSESYAIFRNNLKALAREGLLEWGELDGKIHVTIAMPYLQEGNMRN